MSSDCPLLHDCVCKISKSPSLHMIYINFVTSNQPGALQYHHETEQVMTFEIKSWCSALMRILHRQKDSSVSRSGAVVWWCYKSQARSCVWPAHTYTLFSCASVSKVTEYTQCTSQSRTWFMLYAKDKSKCDEIQVQWVGSLIIKISTSALSAGQTMQQRHFPHDLRRLWNFLLLIG